MLLVIAAEIRKIADSMDEQREYQKLQYKIVGMWSDPENFLKDLHSRLTEIHGGQMSFDQMIRALTYLQRSGSNIKPQSAQMFFHSLGNLNISKTQKTDTSVEFPEFFQYIKDNSMHKLPANFGVLFHEKTL